MHHCEVERDLGERGLRITKDRHAILKLFADRRAWTAAQIHKQLRGADLSTVYRNIRALEASGALAAAHVRGDEAYYELADLPHHDHLLCERCAAAECIPCPARKLATHRLELLGLCGACA